MVQSSSSGLYPDVSRSSESVGKNSWCIGCGSWTRSLSSWFPRSTNTGWTGPFGACLSDQSCSRSTVSTICKHRYWSLFRESLSSTESEAVDRPFRTLESSLSDITSTCTRYSRSQDRLYSAWLLAHVSARSIPSQRGGFGVYQGRTVRVMHRTRRWQVCVEMLHVTLFYR